MTTFKTVEKICNTYDNERLVIYVNNSNTYNTYSIVLENAKTKHIIAFKTFNDVTLCYNFVNSCQQDVDDTDYAIFEEISDKLKESQQASKIKHYDLEDYSALENISVRQTVRTFENPAVLAA